MGMKIVNKHFEFNEQDISEGKYDVWELIQPLWYNVSIYDGIDVYEQDLKPFSDAQRKMLALLWYDAEVNNGGHDQFFSNSTGVVWKDVIDGMRLISATKYVDNFQKAVDVFGGSISFDRDERNEALNKLNKEESFDDFGELDSFYYDEGDLLEFMNEYVKKNAAKFVVNGIYKYYEW